MASLYKGVIFKITKDEIVNMSTGETISTLDIKGQRAVTDYPPLRDYIGFGAAALFGLFCFTKGWGLVGLISLAIGGIGIFTSTKRKPTYDLVIWHINNSTSHLMFESGEEMSKAEKIVSGLISRNMQIWADD